MASTGGPVDVRVLWGGDDKGSSQVLKSLKSKGFAVRVSMVGGVQELQEHRAAGDGSQLVLVFCGCGYGSRYGGGFLPGLLLRVAAVVDDKYRVDCSAPLFLVCSRTPLQKLGERGGCDDCEFIRDFPGYGDVAPASPAGDGGDGGDRHAAGRMVIPWSWRCCRWCWWWWWQWRWWYAAVAAADENLLRWCCCC